MTNSITIRPSRLSWVLRPANLLALTSVALLGLAGCGGDDDATSVPIAPTAPVAQDYELTFTNLTAGQPLSPAVAVLHDQGYQLMTIGQPATVGLERLAEGAETDPLLAELAAQAAVKATGTSTGGPIGPGGSTTYTVSVTPASGTATALRLSLASMLVNSNDAIAAVNGQAIGSLAAGETMTFNLLSYDTGTEANIETAATMPGPAANGEGFNAARDDLSDAVHIHPGPVTSDDGLATSVLTGIHRWNHPVARLMVRRVK